MMVRFTERSAETHRIKNKPISEGYKFFAFVDAFSGNVLYFVPDERMASHREVESEGRVHRYSADSYMSKTAAVIKLFVGKVTYVYFQKGISFELIMETYFTLPKMMPLLKEMEVGCLGKV